MTKIPALSTRSSLQSREEVTKHNACSWLPDFMEFEDTAAKNSPIAYSAFMLFQHHLDEDSVYGRKPHRVASRAVMLMISGEAGRMMNMRTK